MSTTTSTPFVDTDQMVAVHTMYRRELRLAPAAVRRVAAGDVARAEVVADHVALVTRSLHEHHTTEDELLWPLLLERVPDELAPVVHLMESQHETVDALLQEVGEALPRWRATAAAEDRDRLADLLGRAYVHLVEHLDAEEQRLLPIAARTCTPAEWKLLGSTARAKGPTGADGMVVLGMIVQDGDPAAVQRMLGDAPPPVRWLLPRIARRAYRRRALAVHGTATP
ncbi:hemerythrin domain-containing protein [Aquipuribacter sp. SD81]|uniref:hemerythrin domain-containing protein n=1 Tax=Aquipuribacter sp. SD81 TaxID=3127703 RepID=UPI00301B1EC9